MALAATALAHGVRALLVTLGKRGAVYFAAPDFERLADLARAPRLDRGAAGARPDPHGASRSRPPTSRGRSHRMRRRVGRDLFLPTAAGDNLRDAIDAAHRAAARNVAHRGATGLAHHLRGEISLT